jgi:hypothetical protein
MKTKLFCVVFLLFAAFAVATTVEQSVLVARQPGFFTVNVKAALNTNTNQTLVVWQRLNGGAGKNSIWGRLLQPDGNPSGSAFQIVSGPNVLFPEIVYNPDANQFLLLYSNEIVANRFEARIQRLSSTGRKSGTSVRVSLASDLTKSVMNLSSRAVYDPIAKTYVVLLMRTSTGATGIEEGLHGAVFNSNLTVKKPLVLMSPGSATLGPTVTDLDFHSPSKKILAAGYTTVTGGFQYFLSKIDPSLQTARMTLTKLKSTPSSGAAPDVHLMFLPDGNATALFVEGTGLKKRKINKLGTPIGPVSFFYSDSVKNIPVEFPVSAVARNQNGSEVGVVSIEDSSTMMGRIWLQTANASGGLTASGFSLQSGFDTNGRPAIVALPSNTAVGFLYAVVYMEGGQTFPPSPNASSGLSLLRVNTTP